MSEIGRQIPINKSTLEAARFMRFMDNLRIDDIKIIGSIMVWSELQELHSNFIQPTNNVPYYQLDKAKATRVLLNLADGYSTGGDMGMIGNFRRVLEKQTQGKGYTPEGAMKRVANMLGGMFLSKERNLRN